jgi:sec-independent protein translocase protein TatB
MFGIGYQEMFIILVVALVIFGPARLPEMAGQVGRWVRDFRRMSGELTGEFEKTFAEVEEVKRSIKREMQSIQDEVEGVSKSTRGDLKKSTARSSTGAKKATGGALKSGSTTGTAAKTAGAKTEPAANGARTKMPALEARKRDGKGKLAVELDLSALPVATKADPLVDVSFFDLDADAIALVDGAKNGASGDGDAALERVRRRRAAAGYGRRATV